MWVLVVVVASLSALLTSGIAVRHRRRRSHAVYLALSPRERALADARRDLRALRRQTEALGRRREGNSVRDGANDDDSWTQAGVPGGNL